MKTSHLMQRLTCGLALAALANVAGCTSILEPRPRISDRDRKEAEWANLKSSLIRLENRVDSIETVQHRSQEETESLRQNAARLHSVSEPRLANIEQRLAALEKALAESDRARAEDKRLILESIKSAQAARPAPMRGREHTVQKGETLSEIAKAYQVSVAAIVKANNLPDAHTIRIGQTLFIPD